MAAPGPPREDCLRSAGAGAYGVNCPPSVDRRPYIEGTRGTGGSGASGCTYDNDGREGVGVLLRLARGTAGADATRACPIGTSDGGPCDCERARRPIALALSPVSTREDVDDSASDASPSGSWGSSFFGDASSTSSVSGVGSSDVAPNNCSPRPPPNGLGALLFS